MGLLSDTHCHLNLNIFQDDLRLLLERAWQQGVDRILVPGIDLETSQLAVELCERHETLYAAVGIHPHGASGWSGSTEKALHELARHPKTVAIGEIGLDYYRNLSPRSVQQDVFRIQLDLAGTYSLPVIIHNREAMSDVWTIIESWHDQLTRAKSPLAKRPGVFHSFDGNLQAGLRAAEKYFFIGITGPVTFKNALVRQEVAAGLPVSRLLLETDAPYLTPHPYRGRRNEPAYVALIAEKLASLHHLPVEDLVHATWNNAEELFHWGASL